MVIPNTGDDPFEELSKAEELSGKLDKQSEEDKLMHSVVEHDDNTIDDGKLISDVINQGFSSFTPDMMFESLVKDYTLTQNIYGERLIRLVTGHEPSYLKRNIKIPEFQRELQETIAKRHEDLKDKGLLDESGQVTEKGVTLGALVMYTEELDKLKPKGSWGEREHKKQHAVGDKSAVKDYSRGDRYKDISSRKSIRQAIKRLHDRVYLQDLKVVEKKSKGTVNIVYCIDSSGSMKGRKIEAAKKAGIALAYNMVNRKDKVGLMTFGTEVKDKLPPTLNFNDILMNITRIRASKETNMTLALKEVHDMFPKGDITRHIILLTDALPTIGKNPEKEVLETVSMLRESMITVSVIGIKLDKKGQKLAQKIAEVGKGKLYMIRDLDNLDRIMIEDYMSLT